MSNEGMYFFGIIIFIAVLYGGVKLLMAVHEMYLMKKKIEHLEEISRKFDVIIRETYFSAYEFITWADPDLKENQKRRICNSFVSFKTKREREFLDNTIELINKEI